ncbi:MAG: hypothetical protein ACFCUE_15915 [Candidatus Bathyarchaeia archaeon]|jgi:hypothetical protein
MKRWALLLVFLLALAAFLPVLTLYVGVGKGEPDEFYFGVSFGGIHAEEALPLIDKVKDYTNLILINSWNVTTNQTALNMVCDYAAASGLKFVVYFDFISRVIYPWHQQWLDEASQRWGDKFLGIYLRDELGGKQVEDNEFFSNASDYADAAARFVNGVKYGQALNATSMTDAKNRGLHLFTSDFLLYWWDYLGGYDTVFAELGWNISTNRQIALCRGAAQMQGKDWGAIITYKTDTPPYLASANEVYYDMVSAYRAGAKYVVVFSYPTYPDGNPYGILSETHLSAMQQFWQYTHSFSRAAYGTAKANTVLVLPSDYGWGMRRSSYITEDKIWGIWPEDAKSPQILQNVQWLETHSNLQFDIVYDTPGLDYSAYSRVIYWNATLP